MSKVQDAILVHHFCQRNDVPLDMKNKAYEHALNTINKYLDSIDRPAQTSANRLENFDVFWEKYNKKVGRSTAEKSWGRMTNAERRMALLRVKDYVDSTPDVKYRKNPATWLNSKGWEDDIKVIRNTPQKFEYDGKRDDLFS